MAEAQRQWARIINTVQMEKFPDFLRYFLSLRQNRVRRERLFKIIRQSVTDAEAAFQLLDELEHYSGLFIALGDANDEFWRDNPENCPYIREVQLFRIKQAYPTLLAAYEKFPPDDFTRLLKLVCVISFRYTVVSSLNPSELETLYNKVAMAIMRGDIINPRQVFNQLQSIYVSDTKFSQDFSVLSIPTKGQKKKLVRYILWKLELDASTRDDIAEDTLSIEHILPESPTQNWDEYFSVTEAEAMVYRIGNLTPLEPNLNRKVGNQSFSEKQSIYENSGYALTQAIVAEDWTADSIARRQERLAKRAIHIWRSDFAETID